jgi:hypothetical protein
MKAIALGKTGGSANQEMAGRLEFALRSVQRKLLWILTLWEKELVPK